MKSENPMQKALKRWMHATAILFAVMLIGANTGLAQVTVTLDDITGRPGESATVGVHLTGVEDGTAISSFGFDIVTGPGVTYTGYTTVLSLAGDANFFTDSANDRLGGFAQGTNITESGTLVYLMFDLDNTGAGTVALDNFQFNNGDPAVANAPVTGTYTVSTRIIGVTMEHDTRVGEAYTNVGQSFWVVVNLEDALLEADDITAFGFDINFDPTMMQITSPPRLVVTDGVADVANFTIASASQGPGVYRVGGYSTGGTLVGDGLFLKIKATALQVIGTSTLRLTGVQFNNGAPIYATRAGTLTVLAYNVANEDETEVPSVFTLKGNYPNPFNPTTTIQFDLPESADVTIDVMDLLGRRVLGIPAQQMSAGSNQTIQIDANTLSSGIYLYRVTARTQTDAHVKVGTMTLLK
jgi:hypothetical protein